MTFTKQEIKDMLEKLNELSKHTYVLDIAYGGFRLAMQLDKGERTITKNKRYNKNAFGIFLSDLIYYLENEDRKK